VKSYFVDYLAGKYSNLVFPQTNEEMFHKATRLDFREMCENVLSCEETRSGSSGIENERAQWYQFKRDPPLN